MADIKWIKIFTNVFDNKKIRQIESLPDGDAIIVIWFKLLCLAGNTNDNGQVYFTKEIPYTEQMLAVQFNRSLITIQLALKTFKSFGMIEVIDDILKISNWEKYQNIDRMNEIREYNRIAKQKSRARKKLLEKSNVNDMSMTSQRCHDTDIEVDIEVDIEKDIDNIYCREESRPCTKPYAEIVEYLNEKCETSYRASTKKTQQLINARLKEKFTVDDFKTVIDNMSAEWLADDKMKIYLRPETLFGTKFESYLNRKPKQTNAVVKKSTTLNIDEQILARQEALQEDDGIDQAEIDKFFEELRK